METKDGGPAFPVPPNWVYLGMSLRDYFAAHAPYINDLYHTISSEQKLLTDAERAYRWADAMLKVRER